MIMCDAENGKAVDIILGFIYTNVVKQSVYTTT